MIKLKELPVEVKLACTGLILVLTAIACFVLVSPTVGWIMLGVSAIPNLITSIITNRRTNQ